jgi:hypothetical protein
MIKNIPLFVFILGLFSISLKAQNITDYGYLKFKLNVDSATLVANNNYYELRKVANGDSVKLPPGTNLINLSVPFDKKKERYIPIYADSTIILAHDFKKNNFVAEAMNDNVAARYYFDSNVMILTDDESEVFLDDTLMGKGFVKFSMKKASAQITIRNPYFGKKNYPLKIRGHRVNFREFYRRPKESTARAFAFIPGAAQFYKRQSLKSLAFAGASSFLFISTFKKFNTYQSAYNTFKTYKSKYKVAQTESQAKKWGDLAELQQNKVRKIDNQRKIFLISSILVYAYNVYDGINSKPVGGYQNDNKPFRFYIEDQMLGAGHLPKATITYSF